MATQWLSQEPVQQVGRRAQMLDTQESQPASSLLPGKHMECSHVPVVGQRELQTLPTRLTHCESQAVVDDVLQQEGRSAQTRVTHDSQVLASPRPVLHLEWEHVAWV
jgi:hypothetical protein